MVRVRYGTVRYGTVYLPYFMIYIISYDKYGAIFKNTKKFIEFIYLQNLEDKMSCDKLAFH